MTDNIIGLLYNRNEGDILEEIIESALKNVDALLVADDSSTDNSLAVMKSFGKRLELVADASMVKEGTPNFWTRQYLLDEIRKRFNPNDTWVQVYESDMMVFDTDIRAAISDWATDDVVVNWPTLNAVRDDWLSGADKYPNWDHSIKEVMPNCHFMEYLLYTFRPLEGIAYSRSNSKPWPQGFTRYIKQRVLRTKREGSPLMIHYGYRGPTCYRTKLAPWGYAHPKYANMNLDTPESTVRTAAPFDGSWCKYPEDVFPASRSNWSKWLAFRKQQALIEEEKLNAGQ
jgi:hypothetical protein